MASAADKQQQQQQQQEFLADLVLDEPRLADATSSDQGEVFVLQWLSKAEIAIASVDIDSLKPLQSQLERSLLKLVGATPAPAASTSEPAPASATTANTLHGLPKPGRATRQIVARCLIQLFRRIESRSLFEILSNLVRIAGEETKGKVADRHVRVAALYITGEVFGLLGQQVMSLFVDITLMCQRVFKTTAHPVLLRYHALAALNKALLSGGKSLADQPGKDLLKALRQGLADKAGALVRGCSDCILTLSQKTTLLASRNDIESALTAAFKAIETADFVTKRALSRMAAGLLAYTQAENSAPAPTPTKKATKKKKEGETDSDDDQDLPPGQLSAADAGPRTLLSVTGMLDQLSHPFLRSSSTRKTRAAILDVYATLFETLGPAWVHSNYAAVLKHLVDDVPNHSRGTVNRAEILAIRSCVSLILRKLIGERMLGEQAQVLAIQDICSEYLKRWPSVLPEQQPPSKYSIVLALNEVSGLLVQLGSCPPQVKDALYDPLMRCLAHPSHSVQVSAAWCLRTLCDVSPNLLSSTISSVLELLNRDLTTLANGGGSVGIGALARRANGHSRALAALINVIPRRPMYTSFAISSKVLSLAIQLLKNSGNHDLSVSAVEISVAWVLVGALMSLGPNFVRLHLPQLLILWRNALPKPTNKDTAAGAPTRSDGEWGFLLHVRECTLGSLYAFLLHNGKTLLTLDTARRIVALLSNTLAFVDGFAGQYPHLSQEQIPGSERSSLSLLDREHLLRRRLFQCLTTLATNPAMEPMQTGLISVAVQAFAEPDKYVGSSAQAAIAASAGNFNGIWSVADGYAFGVTSLLRDSETFVGDPAGASSAVASSSTAKSDRLNRDSVEVLLDALQRRPVLGAAEHDVLSLFVGSHLATKTTSGTEIEDSPWFSPPPATGAVDAAIELFAALLPYQERDVQISAVEALLTYTRSPKLDKNPGRKLAIQINAILSVLGALRTAVQGGTGPSGNRPIGFNNERFSTAMRDLIQDALLQEDSALRAAASEAYGKLAAVAGSHAMSGQVQFLVDQVVSNRDPDARAGCALAFGAIYREVGGLSAGPLTKTVVNVLMSLSNDPHPTVHYNALEALQMVVDAASLSYSPYVASTLGMLVKLYMLDTHEPEGGSAGSVNLRADLPAHQAICRVINGLIGVLGPDLQESAKVRGLVYALLREFASESDSGVVVEAIKATQHFGLFAADSLDTTAWIEQLRSQLRSKSRPLKLVATNAFYQLVQREALAMSRIGGDSLVEEFFALLDEDPKLDGVREVITSWLSQTADLAPGGWIDLCQRIITNAGVSNRGGAAATAAVDKTPSLAQALQDEEAATIDLGADSGSSRLKGGSRWRTQLFALQCLHVVFVAVRKSGKLEHFNTPAPASSAAGQKRLLMSNRVADLIKMAFSASTAANSEIRLEGLVVLRDVMDNFKHARDPDFEEALLLEQHQAPIAAALTPAFLSDSTPEVLAAAVQLCAVFVGSGVIREVEKMGRILKQLVAALESCMEPTMDKLGDVEGLSPNANAMLKIAVFTAWAELEVASIQQEYLVQVVKPHLAKITPFWIACLREYAKIRSDPDGEGLGGPGGGSGPVINASLDSQYAGLAREVISPYHEASWFKILNAVAVLMNADDPTILRAMDGEPTEGDAAGAKAPSLSRSEPSLFFFVLYGLAFEALSTKTAGIEGSEEAKIMRIALQAMTSLSKPAYAGSVLLQEPIFEELCNLSYRLVMTEPPLVQVSVLEMIGGMAAGYGKVLLNESGKGSDASSGSLPKSAKLTQCLRIVVCVLNNARRTRGSLEDKVALLRVAYSAFIGIVGIFPASLQEELFAIGFYTFSEMLRDETSELDLVGPTLPSLKDLCQRAFRGLKPGSELLQRAVHGFLSAALQNVDEMRSRAGRVAENKTKNSLLAAVVVLTSIPVSVKVSQAVAEHACYLITQKILAEGEGEADAVGTTAVTCARTLILSSSRGNPALQYCVGQLLPGLIEYLVTKGTEAPTARVEEVVRTFVGLLNTLAPEDRSKALAIVLPTLVVLLEPSVSQPPPPLHTFTVTQLMAIAAQHQVHFKEATAALAPEKRALLESAIRAHVGAAAGTASATSQSQRPTGGGASIALKSFGS